MDKNEIEFIRKKLSHCIVDSCEGCPAKTKKEIEKGVAACKDYSKARVTLPHSLASRILDVLDELCFAEES